MNEKKKQHYVYGLDIHPTCFSAAKFPSEVKDILNAKPLLLQDKLKMEGFDKWLQKHTNAGDILVMEALGISFQLVKRIEEHGRIGIVLESKKASKVGKDYLKNDKVDASKLAKLFLSGLTEQVWVPDYKTLERREIFFSYLNAVKDSTRSSSRIWAFLTAHGIIVSSRMKKNYKSNPDSLFELQEWSYAQQGILKGYIGDYKQAQEKRKMFETIIAEEVTTDPDMLKLQQFCGIRLISAYALMAIIGNIKRFKNPKKLVAYIGLQPKVSDSGEKKHSGGISKHGRRDLKAILAECAKAFINFAPKDHPMRKWALKLKYRKSANVVTIAIARKLVTAIWYVLNGYSSPITEISKSIKVKLQKHAVSIGVKRRQELGFRNISHFIEVKSETLLGFT